MDHKTNDISLVVVDAVAPDIEEDPGIALPNIQALIDSGITGNIYELYAGRSELKHNGERTKKTELDPVDTAGKIKGEVILVGGSLGNKHYKVFLSLLNRIGDYTNPVLHIPFDCTYSFEQKYDSGDSWEEGKIASPDMPVFKKYRQAMRRTGSKASNVDFKLWDRWAQMVDYIQARNAETLVSALSVEDIASVMDQYKARLIRIGQAAVKPLQDFLATEGKRGPEEPGTLYPGAENYAAARKILKRILTS